MKGFKKTEIGLIPDGWELVKIKDLGKVVTGTTPSTKNQEYYSGGGYEFVSPGDIGETKFIYKTEKEISAKGLEVVRPLPKNTVMVVCIGSSIGKVGLVYKNNTATNQQINSIICNDNFNPVFVYYVMVFKTPYIRSLSTPSPVPILNKSNFEDGVIPVCKDIEEQRAIEIILSKIQSAIETQEKIIEDTTELKRALMQKIFTEGLCGETPKQIKLGRLMVMNYGKGLPAKSRMQGNIPVYGSNGIVGWHNKSIINEKGIIIGRKGSAGEVHYSAVPFCPIDTTYYITKDDTNLSLEYLFYLLCYAKLGKIKGDVGVPGLNREMAYKETVYYLENKKTQEEVVRMLKGIDNKITLSEKIRNSYNDLFRTLLCQLMTGQIRVKEVA